METDKHYFVVGLFIIILLIGAGVVSVWLAGAGHRDDVTYRIRFRESVSGMAVGDPVTYRGVESGTVESMKVDPADPQLVLVDVRLRKETPVNTDTEATLRTSGLTGVVGVELSGARADAPRLLSATPKDQVPEIPAKSSTLGTLADQLPEILAKMSEIEEQLKKLLSDKNIAALSGTLTELHEAAHNVNELVTSLKAHPSQLIFPRRNKEAEKQREPDAAK